MAPWAPIRDGNVGLKPSHDAEPRIDLTACDREPIHIVGSVQPHGFLLVLEPPSLTVVQASANAPAEAAVGTSLDAVFPHLAAIVRRHLDEPGAQTGASYLRTVTLTSDAARLTYEVAAHRVDGLVVLELEEVDAAAADLGLDVLTPRLRSFVERLHAAHDIAELCHLVAQDIRAVTGLDRALVYPSTGTGTARCWPRTATARCRATSTSASPLGHPGAGARTLPPQPHADHPDAGYAPVPILPAATPSGKPLDLSQSVLRSVSPVHVEYMRNMGTMASMSVSILIDGALWGLISCHNAAPKRVPLHARNACDVLAQIFALQLSARERGAQAEQRLALGQVQARLLGSWRRRTASSTACSSIPTTSWPW